MTVKRQIRHLFENTFSESVNCIIKDHYKESQVKKDKAALAAWKRNIELKDKYRGERCFILGNGPSLREIDFKSLQDEYVFTVNHAMRADYFPQLRSNFHFWIDGALFDLREDMREDPVKRQEELQQLAQQKTAFFCPVEAKEYLENIGMSLSLNTYYIVSGENIHENDRRQQCDLCRLIPSFRTVVQYAIVAAVYMGFKEIYLLGCDATLIQAALNGYMGIECHDMHVYPDSRDYIPDILKQMLLHHSLDFVLFDQYKLFLGYKLLSQFCEKKGIKLINCSSPTLITEIERKDIKEVLRTK